ncbi:MAG: PorV/PorQ family protein, partial [bacterium]
LIICAICLLFTAPAVAQFDNIGTSAGNFLKIGIGSRAEAMAGAFVAQVNDMSALFWNPAGMSQLEKREVLVHRTDWILDINHIYVAAGLPISNFGTLGFSVSSLSMGEMDQTTAENPDGTGVKFSASNFAIGLGYARDLTDRFSMGVHAKYVQEKISASTANTFAVDFGTIYTTGFRGMKIGMSISNFGGKLRMQGREQLQRVDIDPGLGGNPTEIPARLETESWPLPLSFRLGVSMDVLKNENSRLTTNVDYLDPRDINPMSCLGIEYGFRNIVFFARRLPHRLGQPGLV